MKRECRKTYGKREELDNGLNPGGALTIFFRKLDPQKVLKLKQRGLSNSQIAQRLGVTQGAVYHVLRKFDSLTKQTPNVL